jgi:hypothetical protein
LVIELGFVKLNLTDRAVVAAIEAILAVIVISERFLARQTAANQEQFELGSRAYRHSLGSSADG